VASITGKGRWSRGLRVSPETNTAVEVARAVEKAEELYHLQIKQARNSNATAFSDREMDTLAAETMRQKGLRAGMYAHDDAPWHDPAAEASGGVSDAELSSPPTVEERARQTIYLALRDAKDSPRVKCLSDLVREYTKAEGKTGKALVDGGGRGAWPWRTSGTASSQTTLVQTTYIRASITGCRSDWIWCPPHQ